MGPFRSNGSPRCPNRFPLLSNGAPRRLSARPSRHLLAGPSGSLPARSWGSVAFALLFALGFAACGGGERPGDGTRSDAPQASGSVPPEGPRQGAPVPAEGPQAEPGPESSSPTTTEVPEGGLERWVADLRTQLEAVELDPRDSYDHVLELYTTRYAFIERFYGAGGEFTGDAYPEVAEEVEELDADFQELLEMTGSSIRLERSEMLNVIHGLRTRVGRVLEVVQRAGLPVDRP